MAKTRNTHTHTSMLRKEEMQGHTHTHTHTNERTDADEEGKRAGNRERNLTRKLWSRARPPTAAVFVVVVDERGRE